MPNIQYTYIHLRLEPNINNLFMSERQIEKQMFVVRMLLSLLVIPPQKREADSDVFSVYMDDANIGKDHAQAHAG